MAYLVRCFNPVTASVEERLEQADSLSSLKLQVEGRGLVLLNARDASSSSSSRPWGLHRPQNFSVPWWCRELRTLIQAGMTIVEALETLQTQAPDGRRGEVQAGLLKALREGRALSRAMQDIDAFPPVLVASVKASERTSTLVSALDDYLLHEEVMAKLRKHVVSAALYPAVVVGLGLIISLFLLLYVVPRFSGMYVDFHGDLSLATRVLLTFSKAVAHHTAWVVLCAAGLVVVALWTVRTGLAMRMLVLGVSQVDALQQQWDHFRLAKLYQSLALMFKGGYTLEESFLVCETLGLGDRLSTGLARAREELMRGRGVSAAMSGAGLTDVVSERLLAAGERTGSFELVLMTIGQRHAAAFTTFVERATRLVEPLLLLAVAMVVGGIVVMMYMPIFDIANTVR